MDARAISILLQAIDQSKSTLDQAKKNLEGLNKVNEKSATITAAATQQEVKHKEAIVNTSSSVANVTQGISKLNESINSSIGALSNQGATLTGQSVQGISNYKNAILSATTATAGFFGVFALSQIAVSAINSVARGIISLTKEGIAFNSTIQDSTLGIAAILKQFQPDKYKSFQDAITDSAKAIDLLKQKALESPASFSQLVQGFQSITGAATSAGIKLKDQVSLIVLLSQALAGLGIRSEQITQESRALLTGNITEDALAARILGITSQQINEAKAAGQLYEFLTSKLSAFAEAGKIGARNFSTALSNLRDSIEQTAGVLAKPLFDALSAEFDKLKNTVSDRKFQADLILVTRTLSDISVAVVRLTSSFVSSIPTIAQFLDRAGRFLIYLAAMGAAILAINLTMSGLRIAISALVLSNAALISSVGEYTLISGSATAATVIFRNALAAPIPATVGIVAYLGLAIAAYKTLEAYMLKFKAEAVEADTTKSLEQKNAELKLILKTNLDEQQQKQLDKTLAEADQIARDKFTANQSVFSRIFANPAQNLSRLINGEGVKIFNPEEDPNLTRERLAAQNQVLLEAARNVIPKAPEAPESQAGIFNRKEAEQVLASLERNRSIFRAQQQQDTAFNEEQYKERLRNLDQYLEAQKELVLSESDAENVIIIRQIEFQRNLKLHGTDKEKEDADKNIADLSAKKIENEIQTQTKLNEIAAKGANERKRIEIEAARLRFDEIRRQESAYGSQYELELAKIQAARSRGAISEIQGFEQTKSARNDYLNSLDIVKKSLEDQLEAWRKINVEKPGTISEQDLARMREYVKELERRKQATQIQASGEVDPRSFGGNIGKSLSDYNDRIGSVAQNIARGFTSVIGGAISAVSQGIQGLINGTMSWGRALQTIGLGIVNSLVQAFSNMAAEFIIQQLFIRGAMAVTKSISSAFKVAETTETAAHTTAQVGIHATGEAAKTGATGTGAFARGVIRLGETIYHGILTGIKVAAHIAGEIAMTTATIIQSGIRLIIILAENIAYLIRAAFEAAASVAGIPFVGPILAVAAMAAVVAAGISLMGGFADGGIVGGTPSERDSVMIHAAPGEHVTRTRAVQYYGQGVFHALNSMSLPKDAVQNLVSNFETTSPSRNPNVNAFASGGIVRPIINQGQAPIKNENTVKVGMLNSRNAEMKFMRANGIGVIIDELNARGNNLKS